MFDGGFMHSINKNNVLTSGTVGKMASVLYNLYKTFKQLPYDTFHN